jgi:hypothetical protein
MHGQPNKPGNALRRRFALMAALALALFGGCGGDADDAANTPTVVATATAPGQEQDPVGIIALGHSGMNGQNSNPAMPGYGAPQNSWSTGTNPEVNSVYQRLIAIQPEHEGHVFNAAEGGATSDALAEQAEFALNAVPAPALALIYVIGNDFRCDGSDNEARVAKFGENVKAALDVIVEASPRSRILIAGDVARPAQAAEALGADEAIRAASSGTGPCDFFTPDGKLAPERIAYLTGIIEDYEAEQARVCELVPQCSTDSGVLATYQEDVSRLIPGDGHLNIAGQAAVAELIWPTVEALMAAS